MSTPTLGDLVTLAEVETVVRLDGTGGRLGELVLTGDVTRSLTAVLEAADADAAGGAAFFVVGPFGSGKSHFLAAVGEGLLDGFGHRVLAGAVLEGEGGAGEDAAGREEVVQGWEPGFDGGFAEWDLAVDFDVGKRRHVVCL